MYHIKPDKRAQASAECIAAGLVHCLQTTPLHAVTVSDLHRASGVSRATFYRLFDTVEDVLQYRLDQMIRQAAGAAGQQQHDTTRQLVEAMVQTGMEHHDFLKLLVDNGRLDLLYRYASQMFAVPALTRSLCPPDTTPLEQQYLVNQLAMSIVATLITWERNGRKETAAQITQYLRKYIQSVALAIQSAE